MKQRRSAFTLVEVLVVLVIIGILAALLFPAFGRAREGGKQTSCASNLQQIYLAVNLYKQDEGAYPGSLADMLPDSANLYNATAGDGEVPNTEGAGYFKGGSDALLCPDDSSEFDYVRSSYGDLSNDVTKPAITPTADRNGLDSANGYVPRQDVDPARYVWNWYGYNDQGFNYMTPAAPENLYTKYQGCSVSTPCPILADPQAPYHSTRNPIKYSLSYRFAPPQTIITHCIFHRPRTANNIDYPGEVYYEDPLGRINGTGARDIVLRLDGTAKSVDISLYRKDPTKTEWQLPSF